MEPEQNEATKGSESDTNALLSAAWALGAMDRGHNHYSYAVLTGDGKIVVECKTDRELAEHIIDIHNKSLST